MIWLRIAEYTYLNKYTTSVLHIVLYVNIYIYIIHALSTNMNMYFMPVICIHIKLNNLVIIIEVEYSKVACGVS